MTNKKVFTAKIALATCGILGCVGGLIISNTAAHMFRIQGQSGDFSLELNNSKKISNASSSYTSEVSASINTAFGNSVTFKASNVINYASGWQTICSGGYFYNPINNTANKNKLSGVTSIKFESPSNSATLSLYYGNSLDGTSILYSNEKVLNANTAYTISEDTPNYIYIKNNNASSVDITKFTINYSCSDSGYAKRNYKVLMIGNSFSDDTVYFSQRIADSYGINLDIYDAYIGGCTLDQHYSNLTNSTASYSMRSMNGSSWVKSDDMTLAAIIDSKTWDVITFQQASAQVGRSDSYSNLTNLVNAVRTRVGSGPKFYWYQTWAYDKEYHDYYDYFAYFGNNQQTMFNAINTCYQNQVATTGLFEKFIPAGTAVQNMRTSYMKDTISRDGKHMSSIHGRYLLGLNFLSHVLDINYDMSPCSYKPTQASDSYKTLCYEAIRNARKTPLACTNSAYTTQSIGNHNLSDYTEIDAEFVGCSYWNSTDSSNYNKRIANASGSSNKYVTTKRFTSSTLPVGSFIVVGEAFGYRPEAWTSDAAQGSRPAEAYEKIIEIDSSFWSGYQYRAFNIFKPGESGALALADNSNGVGEQYSQIFDNFHIYVPTSLVGTIKTKGDNSLYESDDSDLFSTAGYKFSSYQRVFLDPIMGFYKCDSYYTTYNSYSDDTAKKFVCTRPFYSADGDLPENTVIIVDSGYQWRSDCWGDNGTYSPRPDNVSTKFTVLTSSFMSGLRRRTFNVSSTSGAYVNQEHVNFLNHMRIYVPTSSDVLDDYPTGTFKGNATVLGNTFAIVLAIGTRSNHLVGVSLANTDANPTNISFDDSTKVITISTTGSYSGKSFGTITGTYDKANNRITSVRCSGTVSSYVSNNGSITATGATTSSTSLFYDCNGTTAQLQSTFKRRYMSGSWQVDNSNTDRFTSNFEQTVSGGSVKWRPYSGGAVSLVLNNDLSSAVSVKNLHFWVYNPSSTTINLRCWYYKAKNLQSNGEITNPDDNYYAVAKPNCWSYVSLGFNASIYNFQIADFNSSGVALSFDNIYLFQ